MQLTAVVAVSTRISIYQAIKKSEDVYELFRPPFILCEEIPVSNHFLIILKITIILLLIFITPSVYYIITSTNDFVSTILKIITNNLMIYKFAHCQFYEVIK